MDAVVLMLTVNMILSYKLKSVLSPGGRLRMQLPRGPIEYSFHFIGVGNGTGGFKFTGGNSPF